MLDLINKQKYKMDFIFEIIDKTGRKIRLTKERWSHIRRDHPEVDMEEIEHTLLKPIKILEIHEGKYYYFHYFKHKKLPKKFLRVIVKYKNNEWLVMTAHFVPSIR